MDDLDSKIATLLKDTERLDAPDRRKAIARFIENLMEVEKSSYLLDKADVTNIRSYAANEWRNISQYTMMNGIRLSTPDIQTVMWTQAVLMCLYQHKLLSRKIDFKFDPIDVS